MSLESSKTLAGIGAILVAIPFLNLIGIILVLIAMKGLAEYYHEDDIFKNALYGFIFGIIGAVAVIVVIIMLIIGVAFVSPTTAPTAPFIGVGLFIVSLIVMYIFSLLGAIFYRNSLSILSQKSGEGMFETAGLILLIGAIIPIIGEVLKFIAWILAAVGFFSIKTPATQVSVAAPSPPSAPTMAVSEEKKYCQYCGTENKVEAIFCQKCGKQIGEKET